MFRYVRFKQIIDLDHARQFADEVLSSRAATMCPNREGKQTTLELQMIHVVDLDHADRAKALKRCGTPTRST